MIVAPGLPEFQSRYKIAGLLFCLTYTGVQTGLGWTLTTQVVVFALQPDTRVAQTDQSRWL